MHRPALAALLNLRNLRNLRLLPLLLASVVVAEEPRWEVMPDLPVGVFNAAAGVSGRRIVVTGGLTGLGNASNAVQVFDLDGGQWSTPMMLRHPRHSHAQVTLDDGRVLVIGGALGENAADLLAKGLALELIDLDDPARHEAVFLAGVRMAHPSAHVLDDGSVAIVGGASAVRYVPGEAEPAQVIKLYDGRRDHASVLLPGTRAVVAIGGGGRITIERIDFDAGTSRRVPVRLPFGIDDLAAVALDPARIWIIAGQDSRSGDTLERTWLLELGDTDATLTDGPGLGFAAGVADHVVIDLGERAVIAGGESEQDDRDTELRSAWLLDKATRSITRLPDMHAPHDDAVAVLADGQAWVLGGYAVQAAPFGIGANIPVALQRVERLHLAPDN